MGLSSEDAIKASMKMIGYDMLILFIVLSGAALITAFKEIVRIAFG